MSGDKAFRRMAAVAFAAEMVYQLNGSNMSSPQSAHLNAGARAPTLGFWVDITNKEAIAWIVFLCVLDQSLWPLVGGGLAQAGMMWKYKYAIEKGLQEGGQPTEDYTFSGEGNGGNQVNSQA